MKSAARKCAVLLNWTEYKKHTYKNYLVSAVECHLVFAFYIFTN